MVVQLVLVVQPKTAAYYTRHFWDATAHWDGLSGIWTFLNQTHILSQNLAISVAEVFSSLCAKNSLLFLPDLKSHHTLLAGSREQLSIETKRNRKS